MHNKLFSATEIQALKQALKLLEINKKRFVLSTLFGTGAIGSGIGLGAVSAWLIARAAQLPPVLELSVAATSVRAFGVGKAIFRYLQRISSHWIALLGMASIRTRVYAQLADSPTDIVTAIKRGELLDRTGADVDELGNVVVKSLLPAAIALITSLIAIAIVGAISPLIGIILALCLMLSGIVSPYLAARGTKITELEQIKHRTELNINALTLLESASELRITGKLAEIENVQQKIESQIQKNRDKGAVPKAVAHFIDLLALGISVVSALFIGTVQVTNGDISTVALVVVTLTPMAAFEATSNLINAGIQLVRSTQAAVRIIELLDNAEVDVKETETIKEAKTLTLKSENLMIGWHNAQTLGGPLDLELTSGKSIAIVGPSGIGKSTLLFTLAGMVKPHSGTVTLNGTNVSDISRGEISKYLTLTAEDAHIFKTSILENLRVMRPDISASEATQLLTEAGLGTWLAELPEGVDTILGTDAKTISGGERRRILLARALASPAPFLLLDEPGEHLDSATADKLIADLLQAGKKKRGIVLVTHRLSALKDANEVIVLGGSPIRVIARGSHTELLQTLPSYRWSAEQEY